MSSQNYIHGKITHVSAKVLDGGTIPFIMRTADAEVVWFPAMEDFPDLIGRLRFVADQLATIYSKQGGRVVDPPAPNLAKLEQEWAEHEEDPRCPSGFALSGHVGGQCPDCPSESDAAEHAQETAEARRELFENR